MQKFEYVYQGKTLNNIWQVKRIEKEFNTFIHFQTDLTPYKDSLADGIIDDNIDYDLNYIKHLRNTKKYIRLFYSGGDDSHNILSKFLDNNIFLDEIVVITRNLYNKDSLQSCDQEIIDQALPFLKNITSAQVGNIVFKNYDAEFMKALYTDPEWMFKVPGGELGFRILQPFGYMDGEINDADCQIVGKENPILIHYNNKWYATIEDGSLIDTASLHNACLFYIMPENIKSFIVKARKLRKQLNVDNINSKFKIYQNAENKNHIINIGKYSGKALLNIKDTRALSEVSSKGDIELITKWVNSISRLKELFPDMADGFDIKRAPEGKFLFFIDIDSLEIFLQQELIPVGFQ